MPTVKPEITGRKGSARVRPLGERLVYTIPEAGRLLGLGRNAAYQAAKRGDIPTIRVGRLLRVPKGPLHRLVGAEVSGPSPSGEASGSILGAEENLEETER